MKAQKSAADVTSGVSQSRLKPIKPENRMSIFSVFCEHVSPEEVRGDGESSLSFESHVLDDEMEFQGEMSIILLEFLIPCLALVVSPDCPIKKTIGSRFTVSVGLAAVMHHLIQIFLLHKAVFGYLRSKGKDSTPQAIQRLSQYSSLYVALFRSVTALESNAFGSDVAKFLFQVEDKTGRSVYSILRLPIFRLWQIHDFLILEGHSESDKTCLGVISQTLIDMRVHSSQFGDTESLASTERFYMGSLKYFKLSGVKTCLIDEGYVDAKFGFQSPEILPDPSFDSQCWHRMHFALFKDFIVLSKRNPYPNGYIVEHDISFRECTVDFSEEIHGVKLIIVKARLGQEETKLSNVSLELRFSSSSSKSALMSTLIDLRDSSVFSSLFKKRTSRIFIAPPLQEIEEDDEEEEDTEEESKSFPVRRVLSLEDF
jgi:hypothetical protein